ncbi:hypothetical protein AAMO2058_000575800 [Amorphochlora amoebiformis]
MKLSNRHPISPRNSSRKFRSKKRSLPTKAKRKLFDIGPQLQPPPLNAIVRKGIYRSQIIEDSNLHFVSQLRLKCVINLSLETCTKGVIAYLKENDINLINLGMLTWRSDPSWTPLNLELVTEALDLALAKENQPCLLMCSSGYRITGVVAGCLRKVENWAFSSISDEIRRFAGSHNTYEILQFIESFDTDLVSPHQDSATRKESKLTLGSASSQSPDRPKTDISPVTANGVGKQSGANGCEGKISENQAKTPNYKHAETPTAPSELYRQQHTQAGSGELYRQQYTPTAPSDLYRQHPPYPLLTPGLRFSWKKTIKEVED